mgnify:CR=1 FL=1
MSLRAAINAKCKDCTYDPKAHGGTCRQQVQACTVTLCPLSSRTIRTGDDVLVSTPNSTASAVMNPGIFRSNSATPLFSASMTKEGRTSPRSAGRTPGR